MQHVIFNFIESENIVLCYRFILFSKNNLMGHLKLPVTKAHYGYTHFFFNLKNITFEETFYLINQNFEKLVLFELVYYFSSFHLFWFCVQCLCNFFFLNHINDLFLSEVNKSMCYCLKYLGIWCLKYVAHLMVLVKLSILSIMLESFFSAYINKT